MTALNRNLHNPTLHKKNDSQERIQFKFEKLLTSTEKQILAQDHKSLIEEIKSKNSLLTRTQNDRNTSSTKNLPTYCQKYASILYKKYGLSTVYKIQSVKAKQIPVKFISQEEQINRNIFLGKQYLHMSEQDFEISLGQIFIRLKQISNYLISKCRNLKENDKLVEEELLTLEFFSNKLTNKITSNYITPFFIYSKDIKSPSSNKVQIQDKKYKKAKLQSYSTINVDRKGNDSNLIGSNSPNLLSGFEQKENDPQNLLMSFKPNLETSQNCFSTLKYSQSELNLNFSKNQPKDSKTINKEDENDSLPFSPVQPYRLHKLQSEIENQKINTITDKLTNFLQDDDVHINSMTQQITLNLKKGTNKLFSSTEIMMKIYSQSVDQFSKAIQKNHSIITEQKTSMQNEWNEISLFLQKDIQEMCDLLELQRTENEIKDKKFLQNLDMIQNELIQDIFAQKQHRKADQQVLTQVLTNLIQSIQKDQ